MHTGTAVGPYQIVRQIGAGSMGVVWLADDPRLRRKVALKTVRAADADTAEGRLRLISEARAAATLNHPNIAAVHDVLDIDGKVVVVFEMEEPGRRLGYNSQAGPCGNRANPNGVRHALFVPDPCIRRGDDDGP